MGTQTVLPTRPSATYLVKRRVVTCHNDASAQPGENPPRTSTKATGTSSNVLTGRGATQAANQDSDTGSNYYEPHDYSSGSDDTYSDNGDYSSAYGQDLGPATATRPCVRTDRSATQAESRAPVPTTAASGSDTGFRCDSPAPEGLPGDVIIQILIASTHRIQL